MHQKMNAYMADLLGDGMEPADDATVDAARVYYWKRYGATLLGLIEHHNVRPAEFLQHAHQFDNLPHLMRFESGLKKLLQRLPGQKILFTNAPRQYARQVVKELGLQGYFDQHISIEAMRIHGRLRPKPSRWLLKKVIAKRGLRAHRCVLIEDSRDNLRTAQELGMKTVWVTQYFNHASQEVTPQVTKQLKRFARAGYIDIKIRSIKQLPAHLSRLAL